MAARGTSTKAEKTETEKGAAVAAVPAGYSVGEAKPVEIHPKPTSRSYLEAISDEQREALEAAGTR